jgi:hypothetical protein
MMRAFTKNSEKPFAIFWVMEGGMASSVRLTTGSTGTGPDGNERFANGKMP